MKYNPGFLSEQELIGSFVARQNDLNAVVENIRATPVDSNQHILVIGPRGSGKTMLVLRIAAEIRNDRELQKQWFPLIFAEESYMVGSIAEFWLEALLHLSQQTEGDQWKQMYEELKNEDDEETLRVRALSTLLDFAADQGKRILLVVENFNMLIGSQLSHEDKWALRDILLNEPRIMLLATSPRMLDDAENHDEPLHGLFKYHELKKLEKEECKAIWSSITSEELTNERLSAIKIFTGGNPRLLAIIANFGAGKSLKELMRNLMQLVDSDTSYFKEHLDSLPPVERKVYLTLAELWDPSTARQVANAARLDVSKTSSLLHRLMDRGYVEEEDKKGRTKWYQLTERMFNIYYLMRRHKSSTGRVKALVDFIVDWFGQSKSVDIAHAVAEEYVELEPELRGDHDRFLEELWKHQKMGPFQNELLKAMPEKIWQAGAVEDAISGFSQAQIDELVLQFKDTFATKETTFSNKTSRRLDIDVPESIRSDLVFSFLMELIRRKHKDAEYVYREIIELTPKNPFGWFLLGTVLHKDAKRQQEAEAAYFKALEVDPNFYIAWYFLGIMLADQVSRFTDAERAFRKVLAIKPNNPGALARLVIILCSKLGREEEAWNLASEYLCDLDYVQNHRQDVIEFIIELAAEGYIQESLDVLQNSPGVALLEPLIVGLKLLIEDDLKAAEELKEIGEDVANQIQDLKKLIQQKRGGDLKSP